MAAKKRNEGKHGCLKLFPPAPFLHKSHQSLPGSQENPSSRFSPVSPCHPCPGPTPCTPLPLFAVLTRTSRLPSLSCPLGKPYSSPLLAEISFCQLHTRCVSLFMFFIKSKLVDFFHLLLKQSCRRCSSLVAALVRDMVATFGKCSETRLLPTIVLHCYSVIPTIGHLTTAGRALPMDWLSSVALQSLHVAEHTVLKHTLC